MDLLFQKKIKLVEALCGFQFAITHLDGRTLVIKSHPNEIVRPGDIKSIPGEGMPMFKHPFEKGKLLIHFEIEFPEDGSLGPDAVKVCEFCSFFNEKKFSISCCSGIAGRSSKTRSSWIASSRFRRSYHFIRQR